MIKQAFASVAALLAGVAILLAGQGLQGTLLPVRASLEGFPTLLVGVMGAAYFFGFTVGCLKGGELVRRVGHVRVFAAMTAIASAVPLLHGLVVDPWLWGILRGISGACFAILYIVIESWLNERSTNETRGMVFSIYVLITLTVLAGGQMMMLFADPQTLNLFALASVLVSLAAIPVVLSTSPSPEPPQRTEVDLRKLWSISPAGTLGCLTVGLANGSFWSLAPLYTQSVSDDVNLAAWFMTSAVIGGAIAQWPTGIIGDRIGRRKMLFISSAIGGVIGLAFVFRGDGASFLAVNALGALWGALAFPLYATTVAHANDFAEVDDYVVVSSGLLLVYGAGAIAGPFIASLVMQYSGGAGLFLFCGLVHLGFVLYVIPRFGARRDAPEDLHMDYVDALATAHTVSQVYDEEIQHESDEQETEQPAG